jgi:hypothetical protein
MYLKSVLHGQVDIDETAAACTHRLMGLLNAVALVEQSFPVEALQSLQLLKDKPVLRQS